MRFVAARTSTALSSIMWQDMLYRTDMEGRITMISPAGAKLAGYDSPDKMIGLDLARDLYAEPQDRKKFLSNPCKERVR